MTISLYHFGFNWDIASSAGLFSLCRWPAVNLKTNHARNLLQSEIILTTGLKNRVYYRYLPE